MNNNFQKTLEWLLEKHHLLNLFNSREHFHVRFEKDEYMPLVIERHGDLISVAHYFEQNGDLIQDPEVELHHPSWYPTAITQAFLGRREKFIHHAAGTFVDKNFHNDVSSFLCVWARNLRAQGWEQARIASSNIMEGAQA
ncbi:MAG TPA: hypothetical protein PLV64_22400 [Anaerolineales bacterium]|nr:hypothetical protein [Anaerolineales bacterium]